MTDAPPSPDRSGRRLRIAYVLPVLEPGGAERQMLLLAAGLPRDRFAPEMIVLGGYTQAVDEAERQGLVVHVLGMPRRRGARDVRSLAVAARGAARFIRLVRRRRYDLLDAWLYPAYVLATVSRPFTGVPVVLAGRRSLAAWKARLSPVGRVLDAVARRGCDLVVANSAAAAVDAIRVEGVPEAKVRVIRNAVLPAPPIDPTRVAQLRRAWGVTDAALVVGCVANPRPEKGIDVLLAALALWPLDDGVRAVIVGDGPDRRALEAQALASGLSRSVAFVGAVPDARLVLGAFDVVVVPSRTEGLPNAVLEAAAAGRAIAATRVGGTTEIVVDGESGLLVGADDPVALRTALDRLLADASLRARLGVRAREDVTRRFGLDRLVAETADLYASLIRERRPD